MFTDRRGNSLKTRRVRQAWRKDRPFRILSLDGGGIRGIYTAEFLRLCERDLAGGKPLASYFDMIAGTSTGGIIALGLGLGRSTDEIVSFYEEDGRKIFPPLPTSLIGKCLRLLRGMRKPVLDHEALEIAVKCRFQGERLGDAMTRLVIPAFMMPETEIAVFKTDHHPDFIEDWKTPAWRIARATSAAPTFLKGHEHSESGRIFIDGGVWANNPAMVALVDVLSAYDVCPDRVEVLSIGTGNTPFALRPNGVLGGLWSWREVIKAAMFLTTDNATAQVCLLLGPDRVVRVEPSGAAANIEMDDYDRAFAKLPDLAKAQFEERKSVLKHFFVDRVLPRERFYSVTRQGQADFDGD